MPTAWKCSLAVFLQLVLSQEPPIADECLVSDTAAMIQIDNVKALSSTSPARSADPSKTMVFYNLFVKQPEDIPRIANLSRRQLSNLDPNHAQLWMNSIGAVKDVLELDLDSIWPGQRHATVSHFAHFKEGKEDVTLHDLWQFCRNHDVSPSQVVVYMHSKGAFHSKIPGQDEMREYLSVGALSDECRKMPGKCNVCSTRMSPIPHPHTPGNMWAARCGYVSKLIDPKLFADHMGKYAKQARGQCKFHHSWCVGAGRWSAEHWVYSHPEVQPCDLDNSSTYTWGTPMKLQKLHMAEFAKKIKSLIGSGVNDTAHGSIPLSTAPRLGFSYAVTDTCVGCGQYIEQRIEEYQFLYKENPPHNWWGWVFFFD